MKKKRSIFNQILFPLIILIFILVFALYIALYISGTPSILNQNSVQILSQTTENRKIILENNMVQQWSNLKEELKDVNSNLDKILKNNKTNLNTFLKDKSLQNELFDSSSNTLISNLRKNTVNGSFIIIADTRNKKNVPGIYLRDADPENDPMDYSDITMVRGSSTLSHKLKIPFDIPWESSFNISSNNETFSNEFFYKPFNAAKENPELGYQNLGYWSKPFYLEGEKEANKSYQMITYSVPLVYKGQVYGVAGIDISISYLHSILPSRELDLKNSHQSGYLLVLKDENNNCRVLTASGASASQVQTINNVFSLKKEDTSDNFYKLKDIKLHNSDVYGTLSDLNLYNTNTPFSSDKWALMAISTDNQLFGISNNLMKTVTIVVILCLIIGLGAIYLTSTSITKPIIRLAQTIKASDENKLNEFPISNIEEIDELYNVISDLTHKQKESENLIIEEKSRYQAALESSTQTIFEYDAMKDIVYVYYEFKNKEDENSSLEPSITIENCKETLKNKDYIYDEDKYIIDKYIFDDLGYIHTDFRGKLGKNIEHYIWIELRGKAIYNNNNELIKIIGSMRDIDDEKKQELKEIEKQRRDPLTGLFNWNEGIKLIKNDFHVSVYGTILIFDLDYFENINNNLGIVIGDVILEESGQILSSVISNNDIAVRCGGDEFLLWVNNKNSDEALTIAKEFTNNFNNTFKDLNVQTGCSTGIYYVENTKETDVKDAVNNAIKALKFAKNKKMGEVETYAALPETEKNNNIDLTNSFGDILGVNYTNDISIASLIFNMFDKTNDLRKIMPLLLMKVGKYFKLDSIIMTFAEQDFYSSYIPFQWSNDNYKISEEIRHYPKEDFIKLSSELMTKPIKYNIDNKLLPPERDFFRVEEHTSGICYPLINDENYIGSISFNLKDETKDIDEKDNSSLYEIVKIIATNIGKSRSDSASKAKSDFLSRMSHEIRTPMNAIIGMTNIAMEENGLKNSTKDYLEKISTSSEYLLSIINDILDMSRIESGKMKLSPSNFSLTNLIDEVETLIRPQAEDKELNFNVKADVKEGILYGDYMRINQILINLLGNAIKFTQSKGNILLSVSEEDYNDKQSKVTFIVKDDGIGISRENKERVFHAFEQAEDDTSIHYGGTGLGLAICNNLVKLMGSNIELESDLGKGSTFKFTLLLEKSSVHKLEKKDNNNIKFDFSGKKVLLVEDNELNIEIAKTILEMNKFIVEVAENGQIAVDKFTESEAGYYDLILMDIRMPIMDGLTATKTIRNLNKADAMTVPIVAMSANAFDEDMKKSIESGMNGHISKPIDLNKLYLLLGDLLCK